MIEIGNVYELFILAFLIILIIATIKGVYTGLKEGVTKSKALLNGTSLEELKRQDAEIQQNKNRKEQEKMQSKIYRITHPIEYLNALLFEKIERLIERRRLDE